MFTLPLITWWYTHGWKTYLTGLLNRLRNTADDFSILLLLKTLFAPFRQISAGTVQGSLNTRLHAFFDRTFSRLIGAIVRLFIILAGLIALIFQTVFGFLIGLLWPLIPLLPIAGLILTISGATI